MDMPQLYNFFMRSILRESTLVLPSQQRLHKLSFLQKLGCQKACWDQARLSSLVNKQVDNTPQMDQKQACYIALRC